MAASTLAQRLRSMGIAGQMRVIGFYEDQVGRTYKSQPFKFDVDQYGPVPMEEVIAVAANAGPQQVRRMIQDRLRRDREEKDRLIGDLDR
jgi:hypothetical protein